MTRKPVMHLLITDKCDRDCKWCCNKQYDVNDIPVATKEDIVNFFIDNLAVVDKKPKRCIDTVCDERCAFYPDCDNETHYNLVTEWFKQPYKKSTYKLTQCEYDMLDTIFEKEARFSTVYLIGELKKKGYFGNIKCDNKVLVKGILANCEVIQ